MLHKFCTPLARAEDIALFAEIVRQVHALCADGFLQMVACLLRARVFKQVVIVQGDPAHMVRMACLEPLMRDGDFEDQHERLFGKLTGLLREVEFSVALHARLVTCQQTVMRHCGQMGAVVQQLMRHFSFAPPIGPSLIVPIGPSSLGSSLPCGMRSPSTTAIA